MFSFPFILHLDAVKRRTLPLWIREGLEKMDREKQKKLERERMELERAKVPNNDDVEHQAEEEGDEPHVPRKSKFVSNLFLVELIQFCTLSSARLSGSRGFIRCQWFVTFVRRPFYKGFCLLVVGSQHEMLLVTHFKDNCATSDGILHPVLLLCCHNLLTFNNIF